MAEPTDDVFHFDKALNAWVCPVHGNVGDNTAWVPCYAGCSEGHVEADEDELWYDEGDLIECSECGGAGGWRVCGQCNLDNADAEF